MGQDDIKRRNVLRKIGIAGIVGAASSSSLPRIATADDLGGTPEWTRSYGDQERSEGLNYQYAIDHGLGLEYYGSVLNTSNNYQHEFRMNATGCGRARRDSNESWQKIAQDTAGMFNHEFTVDGSGLDFQSLIAGNDSVNLGCTPPPSDPRSEPDYTEAAKTVVTAAIGRLSPAVGAGLTAYDIYNALRNTEDPNATANVARYKWSYDFGKPFNTSHFFRFFIEQRDGCRSSRFNLESTNRSPGAGYTRISRRISIDQPIEPGVCRIRDDSVSSSETSVSAFGDTLDALKQRHDVARIPQRTIETSNRLREFANGDRLYRVVLPVRTEPIEEVR